MASNEPIPKYAGQLYSPALLSSCNYDMETDNLYEGRKGENEFSEKGTDLKPRPYVSNVSVAFVVISHQIDNGGHHNGSEDSLGLEKAVRSLTLCQMP